MKEPESLVNLLKSAIFMAAITLPLFSQTTPAPRALAEVTVDQLELKSASLDRITFDIRAHVTSSRKVRVKGLWFQAMGVGGVPVSLSPVDEFLTLNPREAVVLPLIQVTIYFRDLSSLKPVEQAINRQEIPLTGHAHVKVDLNAFERLFSGHPSAILDVPIAGSIPIAIPGGTAGRMAALATLSLAEAARGLAGSALRYQ